MFTRMTGWPRTRFESNYDRGNRVTNGHKAARVYQVLAMIDRNAPETFVRSQTLVANIKTYYCDGVKNLTEKSNRLDSVLNLT